MDRRRERDERDDGAKCGWNPVSDGFHISVYCGWRAFAPAHRSQSVQSLANGTATVMLLITLLTPLMSLTSLVTRLFSAAFLATPLSVTTPSVVETFVFKALVERCESSEALT